MVNIIFDVDDTLYDQMIPFKKALRENFEFVKTDEIAGIFKASRLYSDQVFNQSEQGEITTENMHIYRIKHALQDYGYRISDKEALDFQKVYTKKQNEITIFAGMKGILSLCQKSHVNLGIITNGPKNHQWNKIYQLDLLQWIKYERIIISGEVGVAKPNPEIFFIMENKFSESDKTDFYYVGDNFTNDIVGAAQSGWNTVWFNHRRNLPTPTHTRIDASYTVSNTVELLAIINKII